MARPLKPTAPEANRGDGKGDGLSARMLWPVPAGGRWLHEHPLEVEGSHGQA